MGTSVKAVSLAVICLLICACLSPLTFAASRRKSSPSRSSAHAAKGRKATKEAKSKHGKKGRRASDDDDDDSPRARRDKKKAAKSAKVDRRHGRRAQEDADDEAETSRAPREREVELRANYPVVPDKIEVIEYGSEQARTPDMPYVQKSSLMPSSGRQPSLSMGTPKRRSDLMMEQSRVVEIQQALAQKGYLTGEPTGAWDDATYEAMRRFQAAHRIDATGYPTAHALKLLGLTSW